MANISIDRRYWVEDYAARAWPPGADVFNGENNPKANYALDLNIDGKVMTFIPQSVIEKGVYNPFNDIRVSNKSYYMPWFLNQENQQKLAEVGSKVDLSKSDVASYLKDKMGASTEGILIPQGSLPFDSQIVNAPGKVQGIGNIQGQPVYINEDINNTGQTYFTDASGQTKSYVPSSGGGGLFGTGIGPDIGPDIGGIGESLFGGIKDFGRSVDQAVRETVPGGWTTAALLAAGAASGMEGAGATGGTSGGAAGLTGVDAAMADLAAGAPAIGAPAAATGAGLLGGTATDLTAQQTLDMIAAEQAGSMTAAETLAAIQAEQAAGGAAVIGGAGTGGTAAGLAGAGAGRALTSDELAKLGLVSGGLNLAGGLMQGETSKDALNQLAAQQKALAEKTLQMGKFQPVGVTTRFGTSSFTTDPVTGAITPSYTLSPEAKAYQDALSGMATQSLTAGQSLMNLGQGYIGESPEAVRNRYFETQLATLVPEEQQRLEALRTRQQATGRGGLAYGATSPEAGGLMATNPEMAAYYNSLAQTRRQLAANAETQYQNQVNFGTGLLGQATTPFTNVFGAQKGVELAAQQPLELSTNFANTVATRGAAQGANYAQAMAPSLQAQYNAANYNPYATALQGAASNPLTGYGLMKLTGLAG